VLRTGCRAVESEFSSFSIICFFNSSFSIKVDCYDGDNMEPIVYHANTLTTPVTLREILIAIETQAFSVSP
jgi:phosphatidylinositol phospholipase C delta